MISVSPKWQTSTNAWNCKQQLYFMFAQRKNCIQSSHIISKKVIKQFIKQKKVYKFVLYIHFISLIYFSLIRELSRIQLIEILMGWEVSLVLLPFFVVNPLKKTYAKNQFSVSPYELKLPTSYLCICVLDQIYCFNVN